MNEENINNIEVTVESPSLLGMIMSPSEQFDRIKVIPKIWVPLIIISFLMMLGGVLSALSIDYSNDPAMQDALDVLALDPQVMIFITAIFAGIMSLFAPIFMVLVSSVIYLIIAKILKSDVSFRQLFSMNTFILMISVLSVLLNAVLSFIMPANTNILFSSLGSIIQTGNPIIDSVLSVFEVFTIWGLIITAIGLQRVADFSKKAAITVVVLMFLISVTFAAIAGFIMTLGV